MKVIPTARPKAARSTILEWCIPYVDLVPDLMIAPSVVAVRGYYLDSMGRPGENDRAVYDDAFFVISPSAFAGFNGNTDPAVYRRGVATAVAPQAIEYRPGFHGYGKPSGHPAFRQASNVRVRRDGGVGNGRQLPDGSFIDSKDNRFWINLHRGGRTTTSSLGCLTIYHPQWPAFYELVRDQLNEYDRDSFTCLLINDPRIA